MPKVFCENCQFYKRGNTIPVSYGVPIHIKEACLAPQNLRDDHDSENSKQKSIPSIINRFNNCPWFQEKTEEHADCPDPCIDCSKIVFSDTPPEPNSEGNQGDLIYCDDYLYLCIVDNTWLRFQAYAW